METKRYSLKEILTICNGKDHSNCSDGVYPVYGSGGIMRFIDVYLYAGESILLPRKGTLSNVQYVSGHFYTVDTCYYTKINKNIVNPYYLFRLLRSMDLSGLDSGASIPSMTTKTYYGIKVDLPDINYQNKIAEIIKKYDELIENNRTRIKLLEEMSENLYKEWFVRFRFPGHETVKFENGIPKGWKRNRILSFYNTSSGGTPSRNNNDNYDDGTIPWIKTGELQDCLLVDTDEKITETALKNSSAKQFSKDSVLMAMYGVNIGKLAYSTMEAACNQACCVFSDKTQVSTKHYLFQYLRSIRDYLLLISFGAAQQNLSQDLIKRIRIIMPDKVTISKFEGAIEPMYNEAKILHKANAYLIRQRDLLLPRLMSGKLEV